MLSAASSRSEVLCIYCTFRSQRFHRQVQRLGRNTVHNSASPARSPAPASGPAVKAHYKQAKPDRRKPDREWGKTRRRRDDLSAKGERLNGHFVRAAGAGRLQWRSNETVPEAIQRRLDVLKDKLKDSPVLRKVINSSDTSAKSEDDNQKSFNRVWHGFYDKVLGSLREGAEKGKKARVDRSEKGSRTLYRALQDARTVRGDKGVDARLKYEFYNHVLSERFTASDIRNQQTLADLRYPGEWFPGARSIHREIHLHVGPTNSGKTYHALQRLEQAEKGVYAGPLRLLAHEVYARMTAKGQDCSLVTGEERRAALSEDGRPTFNIISCTVEMMPLQREMDVAIIDEIQMLGSRDRGWAWTQALMGVRAKEVHLCGEERTVPLLKQICAGLGESLHIHHYERLSPLQVAAECLDDDLSKLQKGDCIVSFSVMGIHALRQQIERVTGKKVATVYGSLPPETRAQQARLFNDPNNDYDFLVASDAVGMGLNLAIKRIIFEAASKYNGYQQVQLAVADIKQIAGRAGRYRTAAAAMEQANNDASQEQLAITAKGDVAPPSASNAAQANENTGYVTTLRKFDYPIVSAAMTSDPEPILTAGVLPPAVVMERFAGYFPPSTPFSYIMNRLHELSQMHSRYHLCDLRDQVYIADLIETVEGLTIADRYHICASPISSTDEELWSELLPAFARCIANQAGGNIVDIAELPLEVLDSSARPNREYLRSLERLHKGVVCYLWLSFRFAGVFGQRSLAQHVKSLVEEKIEEVLGSFSFSNAKARMIAEKRERKLLEDMKAAMAGEAISELHDDNEAPDDSEVDDANNNDDDNVRISKRPSNDPLNNGEHYRGEGQVGVDDEPLLDEVARQENLHAPIEDAGPETPSADRAGGNSSPGRNQFGGTPPKHLTHLETNITELERNVDSRP